jgi:hypothetical protein
MRLQSTERSRRLAFAIASDLFHRNPSVVVQNRSLHAAKAGERLILAF